MNASTQEDLENMAFILEGLKKQMPKLKRAERIDLGARIRAVVANATDILEEIKGELKLLEKDVINGEQWKAVIKSISVNRLDQKALKEKEPRIYARYCTNASEKRVTFEAR